MLNGAGGRIIIHFSTPVTAVGGFWIGLVNTNSPYSNGLGAAVRVTLANSGTVYTYNYTDLLPSAENKINGFFGVADFTDNIQQIEFNWNRDFAGIDNIYFSTTVNSVLNGGPKAVNFADKGTIPLPTEGTIPEPTTAMLIGSALLGLMRKKLKK